MCGILGYFSLNKPLSIESLQGATQCLVHRGPDHSAFELFEGGKVGLGHTRLSVLDLSVAAHQPIKSDDERYVLIYNGESYNFKDLREELIATGKNDFKSSGDTEVLLSAFIEWGPNFIEKVNGMFALAIYDTLEDECWLFRDRMGIKPLYVYQNGPTIAFASELKALRQLDNLTWSIEFNAIQTYLHLGYIPAPLTIWKEAQKVQPGTVTHINRKREIRVSSYWSLNQSCETERITDEETAKKRYKELLTNSVEKRLISDVPIGTFLSGGIDSSLVTALAAECSNSKIKTFSIGFNESKFDESKYARQIAAHLQTEHTEHVVEEKQALEIVPKLASIYDEPFADSSAIPTLLLSQLVRKDVTVALTGDGGDEQYLGYGAYDWANRLSNPFIFAFRNPIARLLEFIPSNRYKRAAQVFKVPKREATYSHIFSQEQYLFSNHELDRMVDQTDIFKVEKVPKHLSPIESQAFLDLLYYLPDDLLVKVDRASMYHGLECRVPLLDHRLVEFSNSLDKSLKKRGATSKYLMKSVLFEYVPEQLFDRPKWGFSIPLAKWLKSDLYYLIDEALLSEELGEFVNRKYFQSLVRKFKNGNDYFYNRIWAICMLNQWLKQNL